MNLTGIFSSRAMATTMPPFGGAVELGDDQAGDPKSLVKFADLVQGIGARRGIEH
jgi:hypothetical protein